jgi:GTP-binding protein
MLKMWEEMPPIFVTSAVDGNGKDELLVSIEEINKTFKPVD